MERYKVSNEDIERLYKELKGHERKVKAIIFLVECPPRTIDEEKAAAVGVARMTLWRWSKYDNVYARELERQYKKQQTHTRKQLRRSRNKLSPTSILADHKYLEVALFSSF